MNMGDAAKKLDFVERWQGQPLIATTVITCMDTMKLSVDEVGWKQGDGRGGLRRRGDGMRGRVFILRCLGDQATLSLHSRSPTQHMPSHAALLARSLTHPRTPPRSRMPSAASSRARRVAVCLSSTPPAPPSSTTSG
jgi:hypothetical protein